MSDQMNTRDIRTNLRRQLLATVSAAALLASVCGASEARADDGTADRPPLWIEFGGQFAQLSDAQQPIPLPFTPSFASGKSPLQVQKQPRFGFDDEAAITYQPSSSDWVFSGGIMFGRSRFSHHQHLQTDNKPIYAVPFSFYGFQLGGKYYYPSQHVKFADTFASQSQSHVIIDFQVGKDVGLGLLGSSVVSGGIRIAQLSSKSDVNLHAEPDVQYSTALITSFAGKYEFRNSKIHIHDYAQIANRKTSFNGLGPRLDWKASTPIDHGAESALTFDWGASVAILFGRQLASERHQTVVKSYYLDQLQFGFEKTGKTHPVLFTNPSLNCGALPVHCPPTNQHTNAGSNRRSRVVAVPDIGGFAGLSYRYADAKLSLGYRADFFFHAIDGGIGTRQSENRGFFGPYASISIGLGD